ncbi:3-hydroxyacyl-ACP dehydratase FabZ family protein [Lacticaseibacillus baoqingensis]|uniref:3-hydroxyacyl-ACP dehydratase FabZ family protein n=1 Tax=Lacticaseibacillus baoqingensis TaxID=2486013 RepID=A0ABW4E4K5_9LACO|nr:3-hydroxyacyl-ACP dehydratase FabZ family protein [Lacticaseibacillus baoqingensis]
MQTLDSLAVQAMIPNRFPIFYIDRVLALTPDQRVVAEKYVSMAEDHLVGYYPKRAVLAGSLIIEMLAQAASVLILNSPQFAGKTAYLAAVSDAEFTQPVFAGCVMQMTITLGKVKKTMGVVHAQAVVAGSAVAHAELHFVVADASAG